MQDLGGKRGRAARVPLVALVALIALLIAATTAAADPSAVVGQWRFDEAGGQTAIDDGPYGLDGRLGASTAADPQDPARIAGESGGALRFADDSFVRLPTADQLAPATLTVEAVVRADQSPGEYRYIISRGAQNCEASSYGLYTGRAGGIAFYVYNGSNYRVTPTAMPSDVWNGQWHHVAGVFDGSTVRLYVDGRPVGAPQPAAVTIAYGLTTPDTYFGTYQGTCALPLTGDLDLLRIWRGPLAADFVGQLSDAALAPPVTPPTDGGSTNQPVPTATQAESQGDAPASRPVLTPAVDGQSLTSITNARPGVTQTAPRPNAPVRACVISPARKTLKLGRATSLTVKVRLRGRPLKSVKVVARYVSSKKKLASAKTARDGRAKLKFKPRSRGKVSVAVWGRGDCAAAAITVVKR
ncbi:LamG domain-containing protein [Conexibacter woesei]|uniref:LamG domain-containing protein n=1 Tax=Conexibacter woesei TaxID=191495 RepID=UPI0003F79AC0|nr:LamG domain-containing protein [Conexibacter woesei]